MSRKNISNKLMILRSDRKKTAELCRSPEGHVWKNQGLQHRRGEGGGSGHSKEVLHNGKNVIADTKIFLLFLVNNNYYFLLANADLQKISAFVFFDKTYIQKYRSPIV